LYRTIEKKGVDREMKKLSIIIVTILVMLFLTVTPVLAGPPTTVEVGPWLEDGARYNPDGTWYDIPWNGWIGDPNGPMDLRQTGKAYHVVDINDYYNAFAPNIPEGHMVISGSGKLSGQAEYISSVSGLPMRNRFKGNVTVAPPSWSGTYTQYSYAYGTEEEVKAWYSGAVIGDDEDIPELGDSAWWFIHYTEYTAYMPSP